MKLVGSEQTISAAADCLGEAGCRVSRAGDEWYILVNGDERLDATRAFEMVAVSVNTINLVHNLCSNKRDPPLALQGRPFYRRDDGSTLYHISVTFQVPMEIGTTVIVRKDGQEIRTAFWGISRDKDLEIPEAEIPYSYARRRLAGDSSAEPVLQAFKDNPLDWTWIYKVIELVKPDLDRISPGWIKGKDLSALKRAANSIEEAGTTGRHARRDFRGERQPMLITTASQLARAALIQWLSA